MSTTTQQPEILTPQAAAEMLHTSPLHVMKLARSGKLPGRKIGRHWRFHIDVIRAWMRHQPTPSTRVLKTLPHHRLADDL